jgi:hypothetical protein
MRETSEALLGGHSNAISCKSGCIDVIMPPLRLSAPRATTDVGDRWAAGAQRWRHAPTQPHQLALRAVIRTTGA